MWKRLSRNRLLVGAFCWFFARYIRLVHSTCRWRICGDGPFRELVASGQPFITCFWHGRLAMVPPFWPKSRPLHVLVSQHRDGQIIARIVAHLGIAAIAGSTNRGGAAALRAMHAVLRQDGAIGITPDGPRGPRMRAGEGVIRLARLAGVPIVPVSCAVRRRMLLPSWDRMMLAAPFSHGVFLMGEPIVVPAEARGEEIEVARAALEARLNLLTAEADRLCGHEPVPPAVVECAEREPCSPSIAS